MFVYRTVRVETCGIYGGINVVISWKREEGEGGLYRAPASSVVREGEGGEAFSVKCPPLPIYCLWLFCDEIESRSSSPASSSGFLTNTRLSQIIPSEFISEERSLI